MRTVVLLLYLFFFFWHFVLFLVKVSDHSCFQPPTLGDFSQLLICIINRLQKWSDILQSSKSNNINEILKNETRSPAPGEEQPQVSTQDGDQQTGKLFCREGPGRSGRQVEPVPAMCSCGKEVQWHPG